MRAGDQCSILTVPTGALSDYNASHSQDARFNSTEVVRSGTGRERAPIHYLGAVKIQGVVLLCLGDLSVTIP